MCEGVVVNMGSSPDLGTWKKVSKEDCRALRGLCMGYGKTNETDMNLPDHTCAHSVIVQWWGEWKLLECFLDR